MQIRRPSDIGLLIRSARRSKMLSQDQLAQRLDVSRAWIVQIEQGKPSVRLDLVLRVLNELEITLSADSEAATGSEPAPSQEPADIIDIDAIADTGLQDSGANPGKSISRKRRR
jgi:HTH-type transcriptional regulator / antitoxin HipB